MRQKACQQGEKIAIYLYCTVRFDPGKFGAGHWNAVAEVLRLKRGATMSRRRWGPVWGGDTQARGEGAGGFGMKPAGFLTNVVKKWILIIDDKASIRLTFQYALTCSEWQVEVAKSGHEALSRMAERSYDLIFLDLRMPDKDGLEVLAEMRQAGVETPVVLITAYANPSSESAAKNLGCIGCLPKPATPEELRIIASRVLN